MRFVTIVISLVILSGAILAGFTLLNQEATPQLTSNVIDPTPLDADTSAFERAYEPRQIRFPDDLGPHPTFQTEWWYYTGNLADAAGDRYGFQLTFFRRALTARQIERPSEWGSNQLYFAHFTITDVARRAYYPHERFSRGAAGLAGAQSVPYRVWLEDWEVLETGPDQVRVRARAGDVALDLTLEPQKPPVFHGDRGLSAKSDEPGNASYYYSFTRLGASGTITTPQGAVAVSGLAWKDHEWSTSALGPAAQGWDWFSMQLDDGREVMFGQIRLTDGGSEPAFSGSLIDQAGTVQTLTQADVALTVLDYWTSPVSGARYPARWAFAVPSAGIEVVLTPLLADQEVKGGVAVYWEGAVRIEGTQNGYGYVELTGYVGSMQGRF